MRIPTLLQKIVELSEYPERRTAIDVDLLLDYTRVLYADLLEWRSKLPATLQAAGQNASTTPAVSVAAKILTENVPVAPATATAENSAASSNIPVAKAQPSAFSGPATVPEVLQKDIRSLIGINDKYQIMSELFGNDKAAYEDALTHINSMEIAATAIAWLRDRLWITEEHSDATQHFFQIVHQFFGA